jgi:hypothetical protein
MQVVLFERTPFADDFQTLRTVTRSGLEAADTARGRTIGL